MYICLETTGHVDKITTCLKQRGYKSQADREKNRKLEGKKNLNNNAAERN